MNDTLFLYNTKSKQVERFVPHEAGKVKLYTCGPTVYHFAHIGNLRTYLMEDVLEKLLVYAGYEVKRAMNITDVGHIVSDADSGEDKMLAGARREHKSVMEIAQYYTDAFFTDCDKLNIKKPEIVVPATSFIDEYIRLIGILLEKGYAYRAGGNVYFDTSKTEHYHALIGHAADALDVGVRADVEADRNKRNASDFVLWFTSSKFAEQELRWESPWGIGYPGWHIECSAISLSYLGEYLDIHCGGIDNIFPHHTNEIAQSEALIGHEWCRYWFHVQHLVNVDHGKMSKSGEFLTLARLQQSGYEPLVYRMFCLQSHYRKPLVFREEILENVAAAYKKLRERVAGLNRQGLVDARQAESYRQRFLAAVGNDLNTSQGITLVYDVLKDGELNDATKAAVIADFDRVLSLGLTDAPAVHQLDPELEAFVLARIESRRAAKANKDFALADAIREELSQKGIVLKDSREGTVWEFDGRNCSE